MSASVGGVLWVFDANRGRTYRDHWSPHRITGENRASWILASWMKVDKKTMTIRGEHIAVRRKVETDRRVVDLDIWADANRRAIMDMVVMATPESLADMARAIGYTPEPPHEEGQVKQ